MCQLATELLLQIFEHCAISPTECSDSAFRTNQATLAQISLSCSRFRDLANPLLYRAYSRRGTRYDSDKRRLHVNNMRLFTHTLMLRPSLREHVTEVILWSRIDHQAEQHIDRGLGSTDAGAEGHNHSPSQALLSLYDTTISQLMPQDKSTREDWLAHLTHGDELAEAAVILVLAPNLISAKVPFSIWEHLYKPSCKLVIQDTPSFQDGISRPLSQLRHLFLERGANHVCQVPLLPNLETLEITSLWLSAYDGTCTFAMPSIQKIKIHNSSIPRSVLTVLIKGCNALRHFEYEYPKYTQIRSLSSKDLSTLLAEHCETLETVITTEVNPCATSRKLGSFLRFTRLRRLEIPHSCLCDSGARSEPIVSLLPPNIETLKLTNCDEQLTDQISSIHEERMYSGMLPHLKYIESDERSKGRHQMYGNHELMVASLQDDLAELGIVWEHSVEQYSTKYGR